MQFFMMPFQVPTEVTIELIIHHFDSNVQEN